MKLMGPIDCGYATVTFTAKGPSTAQRKIAVILLWIITRLLRVKVDIGEVVT